MAGSAPPAKPIDRQTTTPFLLKLFYRNGSFHRLDDFTPTNVPASHLQIYTWSDLSLRELTVLLTSTLSSLKAAGSAASVPSVSPGTRIAFRLVYPDTRGAYAAQSGAPGRFMARDLGSVVVGESAEEIVGSTDANKTLHDARFIIGDYVSCCVLPPLANGDVAPAPANVGPGVLPPAGNPQRPGRRGGGYDGPSGYGRLNDYDGGYGDDRGYSSRGGGRRVGDRYGGDRGYGRYDDTNGSGGFGSRGGGGGLGGSTLPAGDWRRGERVPDGPSGYRGGRGRGRPY